MLSLIEAHDVETLGKVAEINSAAAGGKTSAQTGYFATCDVYYAMLASGKTSPVALAVASSAVGPIVDRCTK